MGQSPNINSASQTQQSSGSTNALNELNIDDFLDLMIAELQNQDPLDPMDNAELVAQIGQIREIGATDQLRETLGSVLLGQNISSATNLIGAEIDAVSDDNQHVTGRVDRVSINEGNAKLHLDVDPVIEVSDEPGEIGAGKYRYKVVWDDPVSGEFFGIESTEAIELTKGDQSIQVINLPETNAAKKVYRTNANGEGPFHLVATILDGSTSSYTDHTADKNLSATVLNRLPKLISEPTRSFTVSLNNVGEIRPPRQ